MARLVSSRLPTHAADAVALLAGAGPSIPNRLAQAAASLRDDSGVLYCEVDRRDLQQVAWSPGRIGRAIRTLGLTPHGLYWAKPGFSRCELYLPLDTDGALRWWFRSLSAPDTPLRALAALALRASTGLAGRRFAKIVPAYAVVAVTGSKPGHSPWVLSHAQLPDELRAERLRPLVLMGGKDELARVVMLPFGRGSAVPLAVLKAARVPERNRHTEHEQRILGQLRPLVGPSLRETVPRPLGSVSLNGISVGIESAAPGRLLAASSAAWHRSLPLHIRDLETATDWLAGFHVQTEIDRPAWGEAEIDHWVAAPLREYAEAFGTDSFEQRLFCRALARARELSGERLPVVWQHYGFAEWNVYRSGERLTVIDWEGGDPGLPLSDLLYFVVHWYANARRLRSDGERLRGFRRLFGVPRSRDRAAGAAREALDRYLRRLHVPPEWVPLLEVLTWVQRARYSFGGRRGLHPSDAEARDRNPWRPYVAVLAGEAEAMFGPVSHVTAAGRHSP